MPLLSRPARDTPDASPQLPPPPGLVLLQRHRVPYRRALVHSPTPAAHAAHGHAPAALPSGSRLLRAPQRRQGAAFSFTHTAPCSGRSVSLMVRATQIHRRSQKQRIGWKTENLWLPRAKKHLQVTRPPLLPALSPESQINATSYKAAGAPFPFR